MYSPLKQFARTTRIHTRREKELYISAAVCLNCCLAGVWPHPNVIKEIGDRNVDKCSEEFMREWMIRVEIATLLH